MGPYRQRDDAAVRRLSQFLAIALLIHLAATPLLHGLVPEPPQKANTRPIKLVTLTPKMMDQIKRQRQPRLEERTRPEEREKKKEKEPDAEPDGQVVDLPPSPDDTPPEYSDYVSEHNTRTERETVSRHRQKDYQNAMNELTRADGKRAASPEPEKNASAVEIGPKIPLENEDQQVPGSAKVFELPTVKQRDRLALELDPSLGIIANQSYSEAVRGNSQRLKLSLGEEEKVPKKRGSAPTQGQPTVDLVPNIGVMAQISGAPANDHIDGVEEGDGTFLNSREFKYASFFNRMKRGVSQQWQPLPEYRRRDPTGHIYGHKSRVTILQVTLTADGELKNVEVARSSGLDFLDNEALAAFRRAEPFPNPPKGLVDDDTGLIDFPFGFHIEFSRRGLNLPF